MIQRHILILLSVIYIGQIQAQNTVTATLRDAKIGGQILHEG
jgi:hypothetical protein